MNYTTGTCAPVDMNAVCEKPRDIPRGETIAPALPEQLRFLADAAVELMNTAASLERFATGDVPGYDNREEDSLTGYLAWFGRTMQETTRVLRRVQEVVR